MLDRVRPKLTYAIATAAIFLLILSGCGGGGGGGGGSPTAGQCINETGPGAKVVDCSSPEAAFVLVAEDECKSNPNVTGEIFTIGEGLAKGEFWCAEPK